MPEDRDQPELVWDVTQVLFRDALLLHPPTEKDGPTILSISPSVWGGQYRAIDIEPLSWAPGQHPGYVRLNAPIQVLHS
jgi:hypothetical protein